MSKQICKMIDVLLAFYICVCERANAFKFISAKFLFKFSFRSLALSTLFSLIFLPFRSNILVKQHKIALNARMSKWTSWVNVCEWALATTLTSFFASHLCVCIYNKQNNQCVRGLNSFKLLLFFTHSCTLYGEREREPA